MITEVKDNNDMLLALIIHHNYDKKGISFFTPDDFSQQLAFMHHPAGHVILPHVHNEVRREVLYTKEVLVIKTGKMRCDFYSDNKEYLKSEIVETGDVILLANGGHGFECLEETEMFEIKQGPYAGENDKTRFEPHIFN
ncbi:hypothetical protein [Treponema berlinense]|uniref:hypothetical protein n=1 Tax=Treponema berlinense TaxID=225004 RepID=UPI0026EE533F|nr:hypothetical protein [Treponema berlinense]